MGTTMSNDTPQQEVRMTHTDRQILNLRRKRDELQTLQRNTVERMVADSAQANDPDSALKLQRAQAQIENIQRQLEAIHLAISQLEVHALNERAAEDMRLAEEVLDAERMRSGTVSEANQEWANAAMWVATGGAALIIALVVVRSLSTK